MTSASQYRPDDDKVMEFRTLEEKFAILKAKHPRRKRSPLKFVEAYDDFLVAAMCVYYSARPEFEGQLKQMKDYAMLFFSKDYEDALRPAEQQRARNQERQRLWDEDHPGPRDYEGGRADGNSR